MGITIAIGAWLGRWIDRQLGLSKPIFLLIISLLAVAGAIFMVIRDADKFGKKN
jgi:F0F1-type ATP synthase assembly protein I